MNAYNKSKARLGYGSARGTSLDDVTVAGEKSKKNAAPKPSTKSRTGGQRSKSANDVSAKDLKKSKQISSKFEKSVFQACDLINKNPGEAWEQRVKGLRKLKELFEGQTGSRDDTVLWTKEVFDALLKPIEGAIKDLRSNITKEVGATLVALAASAGNSASSFLFKLLPTVVLTLNSGNKVIFGHMDDAMREVALSFCVELKPPCPFLGSYVAACPPCGFLSRGDSYSRKPVLKKPRLFSGKCMPRARAHSCGSSWWSTWESSSRAGGRSFCPRRAPGSVKHSDSPSKTRARRRATRHATPS